LQQRIALGEGCRSDNAQAVGTLEVDEQQRDRRIGEHIAELRNMPLPS